MPFLVYIVILVVSISGILLELDWLTKPKLETKSPAQAVTTSVAPASQANAKVEGQSTDLTPVYPKKLDLPQSAVADADANAPAATNSATPPAQQADRSTTGSASLNTAETPPAPAAVVPPSSQSPSVATAPNRCNVQACSSAYQSFRVSDCTYQPFEGPRRICERPPAMGRAMASQARAESRGEVIYRKRADDLDRDVVVRRVRPIDEEIDDADDRGTARSRVIVIERPADRSW